MIAVPCDRLDGLSKVIVKRPGWGWGVCGCERVVIIGGYRGLLV